MRWIFAGVFIAVAACGQQTQDSSEVTLDSSVVKTQAAALTTALSSATKSDGEGVAAELADIGNTAAALVPNARPASRSQTRGSSNTCTCSTASQKTCTWSACKIGSATASGTISWASGKLTCTNLTFDVAASGEVGATHVAVTCAFTYGTETLAGSLRATGSTTVNNVNYTWDATLTATDVAWTEQAFTGGDVDVNATVTAGDETFHASGAVSFP
jgi:hypothetical protein